MNATVATCARERVFRRAFPPQPSSAQHLRDGLARYFATIDVKGTDAAQLLLCADEALINAVAHAPQSPVLVAAWVHDDRFVLEVSDEGPGFDVAWSHHDVLPDLDAEHGRGLFLIHQLMKHVRIDSGEHGTTIRMELRLSPAESPLVA
jgi:anti-sigma regulatory factor (Ser/Thr protein kinase)